MLARTIISVAAGLAIAACSTPERQKAMADCHADSYAKFSPVMALEQVQKSRQVRVEDGVNCTSTRYRNSVDMTCIPRYRNETQYYSVLENVDQNSSARSTYQNACADTICLQQFGNDSCKKNK